MNLIYDPALVALSIAMAMLGAFTGLVVTAKLRNLDGYEAVLSILLGALTIGGGTWAAHVIALCAIDYPVQPHFDLVMSAISGAVIILFTAAALSIVSMRLLGILSLPAGAVCFVAGLAIMVLLEATALTENNQLDYSVFSLVTALAIAAQAAIATLWFVFHERALLGTFVGSAALGLALSAAQFSALASVQVLPAAAAESIAIAGANYSLALSVAIAAYALCGLCIGVFTLVSLIKQGGPRGAAG